MAQPILNNPGVFKIQRPQELEFPKLQETDDGSFADLFRRAINDASGLQAESQQMITAFVRGEPVELHQVMAAAEEASISLELLVEIRNKLTEAYRTVMNMS